MDIAEILFQEMRHREMSLRDFAALTGVDHSTLSQIRNKKQKPSPQTVHKLAPYLSPSEDELMALVGYRSETPSRQRLQPTLPIAVPVYDQPVSAGKGEPAIQQYLYFSPDSGIPPGWYGLPVIGSCMVPHLFEGDVVVVDPEGQAEPGDMVVTEIDHEQALVKWFTKHRGQLFIEPERGEMVPFDESRMRIVGVVMKMWRDVRRKPRKEILRAAQE